jgi:transposase
VERGAGCVAEPGDALAGDRAAGLDAEKKTLGAAERDERARAEWRELVRGGRAEDFVVVDECGSNTNLAPRYGRAPRGERARGSVPRNTGPNITLVASMTTAGMGPAMVLAGATDRPAFEAYVERLLAPSLAAGQVVLMDNLSAHKTERIKDLIEARGCELRYLPSYSPDLSPIEEAFSKLKGRLRRAEARTRGALEAAIADALDAITPGDARGYFRHCGYGIAAQPEGHSL